MQELSSQEKPETEDDSDWVDDPSSVEIPEEDVNCNGKLNLVNYFIIHD